MECAVCYNNNATCKLVCKHSFCRSCVKSWYEKSDEPSCPMCRHKLYFKGMYKLERVWEQERIEKMNQAAFDQEFDYIFEEEESDWETSSESERSESDAESNSDGSQFEYSMSDCEEPAPASVPACRPIFEMLDSYDDDKYYSEFMLGEIKHLQKNYNIAMELGVDFQWYMNNMMFYSIAYEKTNWIEDDILPHEKNLFISNYNGDVTKRCSARVPPKGDTSFVLILNIEVF